MASELDQKSLEQAFGSRPDIQGAIKAAAGMPPLTAIPSVSRLRMKSFQTAISG
jgi:hypothetical protein